MKILFAGIIFFLFPFTCFSQSKESFFLYFDFDSYAITRKAAIQLDNFFNNNKEEVRHFQFELYGHCDSIGSESYNDALSEKRVEQVRKYLVKKGLRPSKNIVALKGFGKRSPLNENKTEEERQLNRRVEIIITKSSLVQEKTVTLKEKISDSTTVVGTSIILRNINFVGGMHIFLRESEPMLKELLDAMRTYPQLVIRVEGHICCVQGPGDGPDNGTGLGNLSEARAQAVHDWLLENGVAANRVSYRGLGHSAPIYPYPELTDEERIANRRVEIKIISK